jgi:phenylpropionate dioxygenase-like ring-hydroxylating dioxygenase large terminal subunit
MNDNGTTTQRKSSEGNAYGRGPQSHDAEITEVGPGTPCGEFMRRYWHPVAVAESVTDVPQKLRILGEDLVIFRDKKGRVGLLHARCAHRGTSLYYGKVDDRGIRCCYHGWLFDVEGRCLEQPCEPELGAKHRDKVRQPWYPTEERYGLVFAYMGPPEKMPALTRWDTMENLGPDEAYFADGSSVGAGGDHTVEIIPTNWLHDWENIMDPYHIPILHISFSGAQFVPEMGVMPDVTWDNELHGMKYTAYRKFEDGREMDRVTLALCPNVRIVPDPMLGPGPGRTIGWVVPIDDTHHRLFHTRREHKSWTPRRLRMFDGRFWSELNEAEHQRFPGDWEAQVGQGPISLHSEEHLATSDRGVAQLRRLLRREIRKVAAGEDPIGVTTDPGQAVVKVTAGNFFKE